MLDQQLVLTPNGRRSGIPAATLPRQTCNTSGSITANVGSNSGTKPPPSPPGTILNRRTPAADHAMSTRPTSSSSRRHKPATPTLRTDDGLATAPSWATRPRMAPLPRPAGDLRIPATPSTGRRFQIASVTVSLNSAARLFCVTTSASRCSALTMTVLPSRIGRQARFMRVRNACEIPARRHCTRAEPRHPPGPWSNFMSALFRTDDDSRGVGARSALQRFPVPIAGAWTSTACNRSRRTAALLRPLDARPHSLPCRRTTTGRRRVSVMTKPMLRPARACRGPRPGLRPALTQRRSAPSPPPLTSAPRCPHPRAHARRDVHDPTPRVPFGRAVEWPRDVLDPERRSARQHSEALVGQLHGGLRRR